jgi:hypothetical protein
MLSEPVLSKVEGAKHPAIEVNITHVSQILRLRLRMTRIKHHRRVKVKKCRSSCERLGRKSNNYCRISLQKVKRNFIILVSLMLVYNRVYEECGIK